MAEIDLLKRGLEKIDIEILEALFDGRILRSNKIVEKISVISKVSAPTVYSRLKILEKAGLVKKIEISIRKVQYELTSKGNDIVKEQCQITEERLLNIFRNLPDPYQFVAECLLLDILDKVPEKWRLPRNRQMLKELLIKNLYFTREQIIEISKYSLASC